MVNTVQLNALSVMPGRQGSRAWAATLIQAWADTPNNNSHWRLLLESHVHCTDREGVQTGMNFSNSESHSAPLSYTMIFIHDIIIKCFGKWCRLKGLRISRWLPRLWYIRMRGVFLAPKQVFVLMDKKMITTVRSKRIRIFFYIFEINWMPYRGQG